MKAKEAEDKFRSMAVAILAACKDADLKSASFSVIPKSNDPDDYDWWRITYDTNDGNSVTVTSGYEVDDD